MKKRPAEAPEDSDTPQRRRRIQEVLEVSGEEQGFLESIGVESMEVLSQDEDAAMGALSLCGTSEGLEDIEPPLYGRILMALAAEPEYAQMIVESEEDHSFRGAIDEMPKAKRPRYIEQLEKALVIARVTLEKEKEKKKKKKRS